MQADAKSVYEETSDAMGTPIVPLGVPPAPSAFDGQFVQMDVVAVAR